MRAIRIQWPNLAQMRRRPPATVLELAASRRGGKATGPLVADGTGAVADVVREFPWSIPGITQ